MKPRRYFLFHLQSHVFSCLCHSQLAFLQITVHLQSHGQAYHEHGSWGNRDRATQERVCHFHERGGIRAIESTWNCIPKGVKGNNNNNKYNKELFHFLVIFLIL